MVRNEPNTALMLCHWRTKAPAQAGEQKTQPDETAECSARTEKDREADSARNKSDDIAQKKEHTGKNKRFK